MSSTPNHDSESEECRMSSKITKSVIESVKDKTEILLTTEKKESNTVEGYNQDINSWHCLTCGVDMGTHNPRQLCGKWKCLFEDDV